MHNFYSSYFTRALVKYFTRALVKYFTRALVMNIILNLPIEYDIHDEYKFYCIVCWPEVKCL